MLIVFLPVRKKIRSSDHIWYMVWYKLEQKLFPFSVHPDHEWSSDDYATAFSILRRNAEDASNINSFNNNMHMYFALKRRQRKQLCGRK